MLEQLVGRQELTLKVCRDKENADDYSGYDVANDYLQVGEIAALLRLSKSGKGQSRNTDERQRARLGRDNRKADDDPRRLPAAEEIVFDSLLRAAEESSEDSNADEI